MKERALLQREEGTTIARQAGRKACGYRNARFSKWLGEDPRDLLPLVTPHEGRPGPHMFIMRLTGNRLGAT